MSTASCLCAPTSHKGSFRCHLHRAVVPSVATDQDSWSGIGQASATPVSCLCAPTSHPGSFRCRLHRTTEEGWEGRSLRPSAPAKSLRSSEFSPAKSGDTIGLEKSAFARTNRTVTESKLRSELNMAMPNIVATVEKFIVSPEELLMKKGKQVVPPGPARVKAMVRAASNNSDYGDKPVSCDTVSVRVTKEITVLSENKGVKRPPAHLEQRLRAKSDVLALIL